MDQDVMDGLMLGLGALGPVSFAISLGMYIGDKVERNKREREAREAEYRERVREYVEAYMESQRPYLEFFKPPKYTLTRQQLLAERASKEGKARAAANAKSVYDPAKVKTETLNRQKLAADSEKDYQQKIAAANIAQMASKKAMDAQIAHKISTEATADSKDFISSIEKQQAEKQSAADEQMRLQKERTANLSLALKTRLGVLDQQKADQKAIQEQNVQLYSNQLKQQSDQQTELQKRQAAQALARQGIKTVGSGKVRRQRKKSSMIY
jgi:hypothetical protein